MAAAEGDETAALHSRWELADLVVVADMAQQARQIPEAAAAEAAAAADTMAGLVL
jgi:hypothetical protein